MKKVFLLVQAIFLASPLLFADQVSDTDKSLIEVDSLRLVKLQEVEVSSIRAGAKTPVAYTNMSKDEIESLNFGQDIPYLLSITPSVTINSDAGTGIGYTGFRIRGTDANRINITSNGIPMNDSESHGVFWVNVPDLASSVQSLQIQRGVGTSTNGAAAFGASVNMKTENISDKAFGEFDGSYGSFNTQKTTFKMGTGTINDHFAFNARLSSITSDGFIDRSSTDLKSYFLQGSYFNEQTLIKLITFGGKEKTYHAWDGVPEDILKEGNRTYNPSGYMGDDEKGNPLYYKDQTDNYEQTHYQLSLLHELHSELRLNVALHYTKGAGYYEEYKTGRTLKEYGLKPFETPEGLVKKSDLIREKHLDNDFGGMVFSLDHKSDKLNLSLGGGGNHYDGNHFGYVKWTKGYTGDPAYFPPYEFYRNTGRKTDMNVYLKADYQLTDALNIYGDVQYRYINYRIKGKNDKWDKNNEDMQNLNFNEKFDFLNPKAGVFYQINDRNRAFASFALAHREPNRRNYTDSSVKDIPKAEQLADFELGYNFNHPLYAFGINWYYMQYKDQLVLNGKVNEIGEPLTSNVPESYRTGIEFTAGVRITPWLKWDGNLTWSSNKIKNYTEYVTVYDATTWEEDAEQHADHYGDTPIAYSPEWIANSIFSVNHKGFSAGFLSNYVSDQHLDNTGDKNKVIPSYFVSHLRLAYQFNIKNKQKIEIKLLVNNLFDEKYENNGWLWSCYYRQSDGTLDPYTEKSYFPQAGRNFMAGITVRF